jgi:hypothetical protein
MQKISTPETVSQRQKAVFFSCSVRLFDDFIQSVASYGMKRSFFVYSRLKKMSGKFESFGDPQEHPTRTFPALAGRHLSRSAAKTEVPK